ncbi:MAG: hypothetical protein HY905_12340 [Deltaproteobacteria bacterium]|nr:hypothetical protein [Deltaproteobacteria bacterium]
MRSADSGPNGAPVVADDPVAVDVAECVEFDTILREGGMAVLVRDRLDDGTGVSRAATFRSRVPPDAEV